MGNLLAETRADGVLIRDYVWMDSAPIAQVNAGEKISYLHSDHLNTPRLATNVQGQIVWRWEGSAFGDTPANDDPDGDGVRVTVNLRFPGQYYDSETGLHYSWNRYYDPRTGRYITSDPIGLEGGLNTYAYVSNNPLRWTDPLGLVSNQCDDKCDPDKPNFSKPCFVQCKETGACFACCGAKGQKYCLAPMSKGCLRWGGGAKDTCTASCLGTPPDPKKPPEVES